MIGRVTAAAVGIALLVGCAPLTEENAPEKLALTVCRKHRACDTERWDETYDRDFVECVDENQDFFEDAVRLGEVIGLEVDLEEVARCRADIAASSCDEFEDGDYGPNCDDMLEF